MLDASVCAVNNIGHNFNIPLSHKVLFMWKYAEISEAFRICACHKILYRNFFKTLKNLLRRFKVLIV